jgi:hypothetical protein
MSGQIQMMELNQPADEFSIQSENECCICYEAIGKKNNCTTPCGHSFCFECMMKSLGHNNTCPCCRAVLQEEPANDDEDDEEYDDSEEDIESGDEEDGNDFMLEFHQIATPDVISEQLAKLGYTMVDILALYLNRIDRDLPRNTREFTQKMVTDIDTIIETSDDDAKRCYEERNEMGEEDVRTQLFKRGTVFDIDPLFTLTEFFQ